MLLNLICFKLLYVTNRHKKTKKNLKKLVIAKTKIKILEKIYYNRESNEDEINKIIKEIKTIKRPFRNRKNKNKNYDVLSLRITELETFIIHYENGILVLRDRNIEFENKRK